VSLDTLLAGMETSASFALATSYGGYSSNLPLADLVDPSVTVVAQQPVALGRRAAELLFERIDGYTGAGRTVVVDTDLIVRESSEVAAAAPPPAR